MLARSVSDCDNIDRFGPWRIHETLVWRDFLSMSPEEQLAFVRRQVQGLEGLQVDFATRTAGRMFCEQLQFQLEYYRRLARQLIEGRAGKAWAAHPLLDRWLAAQAARWQKLWR